MADDAKIEGDIYPANTRRKPTPLTVKERQQVVSQLMIGCTWVDDAPKLDKKAVTRVAKDFNKHVVKIRRVSNVLEWCEEEEIQDLALYVEENYG
jgi:hypothetical protein